jgi:hypothetical protein
MKLKCLFFRCSSDIISTNVLILIKSRSAPKNLIIYFTPEAELYKPKPTTTSLEKTEDKIEQLKNEFLDQKSEEKCLSEDCDLIEYISKRMEFERPSNEILNKIREILCRWNCSIKENDYPSDIVKTNQMKEFNINDKNKMVLSAISFDRVRENEWTQIRIACFY